LLNKWRIARGENQCWFLGFDSNLPLVKGPPQRAAKGQHKAKQFSAQVSQKALASQTERFPIYWTGLSGNRK